MDVLTPLLPAALFSDQRLFSLVVARMANVSLEHGHTDGSCLAYVWLGLLLGPRFNNYPAAFAFGQLGLNLMEKRSLDRFRARVLLDFSHVVNPWMQHARVGPGLARRAFDAAYEAGDLVFAGYSGWNVVSALLATGAPLSDVQREAEKQLAFVLKLRFGLITAVITGQLRLIVALRGLTPRLSSFDGPDFEELGFERRLDDDPAMAPAIGWYGVRKLQGRFLAGDYRGALAAADKVERVLWTMPSHLEVAEYHLYAACAKAACYATAPSHDQPLLLRAISAHYQQIDSWAQHCPENFENRAALVGAEIARIEGRELDAEGLYEQAIRSARANGFVHNEALAYELAAHFYLARGFEDFARVYLLNARHGYLRWGADGKVRQIDAMYPHLRIEEPPRPTSTIEAPVEQLDLATVIKVSQAVSSEIVLDKLLDTLLRAALEHAGAGRGLMILLRRDERRIAAEAITSGDTITVQLRDERATAAKLPESILQFVMRTHESVILDEATGENPFSADVYIRQQQPLSILCLPLINQAKLIGALYLENELASHVFAPARVAVLKLLASQAAIALENSRLYSDVAQREAKIRRLVDANIVGIFVWNFEGRILEANDAFLRIIGYDRDDLAAGALRWTDLTPPDWRERDEQWLREHKATGLRAPVEKEYFRKDGSRVPVLLAAATFDESETEGVGFVLDLTERKGAEEALRRSEAYLAEAESLSKSGSWAWKTATREITYWSQGRYRLFGFDPAAGVPTLEAVLERIHPEDRTHWLERTMSVVRGRETESDFRIVLPNGEVKHVHGVGHPVFSSSGEVVELIGSAVDVTERKQAEAALRESEEQWKAVFENNPTMYFMVDATDTILSVNPFGAEQLGYTPEELIGGPLEALIHDADRESALKNKATCLEHLGQTMSWELRKVRKNGEVLWTRQTGRAMLIKNRPVVLVASEDITEAKRAADALREMQVELARTNRLEAMGQLTASIAHEVNQPIVATITNANAALRFLDRPAPDLDQAKQALGRILRDGTRAGAVVQRIRSLIKKEPTRDDCVDMSAAVREVIELSRAEAVKSGVSMQTELAEALPVIRGNRVDLQQVILNLILNAVEAMSEVTEGLRELRITTGQTESGDVLVSVSDTGPGLSPVVQENLFKAFYTTKANGLGLGLSICRSTVEAHGGRLSASANAPRGAVFQFTLRSNLDNASFS
jgi:PAS domain S-box-containing protein